MAHSSPDLTLQPRYYRAFDSLSTMLKFASSFETAISVTEAAYLHQDSTKPFITEEVDRLEKILRNLYASSFTQKYHSLDSSNYLLNYCLSRLFTDTMDITYNVADRSFLTKYLPFDYDFTDPEGKQDWGNMLVTKLLATRQGNCHSLAYLYKILADRLGAKCWLALAPGHIYIRNYSDKIGWYNTELTSGTFPTDAWVMTTSYVSPQAIRSELYMDTLSNQQSIALCVLDLAKEYEFATHNYYDGFIIKCCNLVLQYHPVNPMALLLKAETLKKVFLKEQQDKYPRLTPTYAEMEDTYITLAKLGYREMSDRMYAQWQKDARRGKGKYPQQ